MEKLIGLLNRIFPFSYLTLKEKQDLIQNSQFVNFEKGDMICEANSTDDIDRLFLLLEGNVKVIVNKNIIGKIESPSYFGERAVLFNQARKADIQAQNRVNCMIIDGDTLRKHIHTNINFRYSFSSILRHKHKLFGNYDGFIHLLMQMKDEKRFFVLELLEDYKLLLPSLHSRCTDEAIDFSVLSYVISRFPQQLHILNELILVLDLPSQYESIKDKISITAVVQSKRSFYEILPGRILVVLRDDLTDYIDIMTKLCAFLVESTKIRERLLSKPSSIQLLTKHYYADQTEKIKCKKKIGELPFSANELKALKSLYGQALFDRLYENFYQNSEIQVRTSFTKVRYYSDRSELWIEQIVKLMTTGFSELFLSGEYNIHIVSSNTHSVLNCLSPWVHLNANTMVDRSEYAELSNPTDQLYAGIKKLIKNNPDLKRERASIEKEHGIFHLDNSNLKSIEVDVIDLGRLTKNIDPDLAEIDACKKSILFNIDYAYGKQAESIIRNLILLFGNKIKSISIFGKAGCLIGEPGELIIPNSFIMQENDAVYPIKQADISAQDYINMGWDRAIHHGTMLTVLGTLMQNAEMLRFYQLFWNTTGLEMEGGYFLQEIHRSIMQNLIDPDVLLRFAYYISDTPLNATKTLASKLTVEQGLPPVYAITRTILKKIMESKHDN